MNNIGNDRLLVENNYERSTQRRMHIKPGDLKRETYRLTTFKDSPYNIAVRAIEFSSNGLYYTGFKDQVKCFSCGKSTENWQMTDDIQGAKWHLPSCCFLNGTDISNIPLEGMLSRRHPENNPPGFSQQIVSHFQPIQLHTTLLNRFKMEFLCREPINPHLQSKQSRIQTFSDKLSSWSVNRIRATPKQITEAGMFYLGEKDRVKCWYCNGGIQNWERDDDPWTEHAKWFPLCEFVLQQKGVDFVEDVISRYPQIIRPLLYNPSTASSAKRIAQRIGFQTKPSTQSIVDSLSSVADTEDIEIQIENEMQSSRLVLIVKQLGFDPKTIREALKCQFFAYNEMFQSLKQFMMAMIDYEEKPGLISALNPISSSCSTEVLSVLQTHETANKCCVCLKYDACVIYTPTRKHFACCSSCAQNMSSCPICKNAFNEKVSSMLI